MIDLISKKLAPTGILRVGINMSNFLLVSGVNSSGLPKGVSPDLGEKIGVRRQTINTMKKTNMSPLQYCH